MKNFQGRVAVITGAASGIGYSLAEHCAKEGMKVVLADIEKGALAKAEKEIKAMGANTLAVRTDVSKAGDVEALAKKTLDAFGSVHLLFNNAGVTKYSTIWEYTLADWHWILGVNLFGVIYGVHFFVPIMLKQNTECHIVNTASVTGLSTGVTGPYEVSKHGIVVLSETLYHQLVRRGSNIMVSVICPGGIKTNIMDSERHRPAEVRNKPGEGVYISDPFIRDLWQKTPKALEITPQQAADIVFAAIRENKFYILPNGQQYKPWIQTRMEDILQERNPTPISGLTK